MESHLTRPEVAAALATGEVEVNATALEIHNISDTPPVVVVPSSL